MVVQVGEQSVGLIVDAVSEVTTIPSGVIEPVAAVVRGEAEQRLLRGVARLDERLVMLLDLERVIQTSAASSDLEALAAA